MGRVTATALALALGIAGVSSTSARGDTPPPSSGLHVIPFPGTPDASPRSNIIFSSLTPADIVSVMVRGSRSGSHSGHLEPLPDGAGTAFVPNTRFRSGELVNVDAALSSPQAGTASGDPQATEIKFSFTVAVPAASATTGTGSGSSPVAAKASVQTRPAPTQDFLSEPDLRPPDVTVTGDPDPVEGDVFLTPYHGLQSGPMILNPAGQLVWFYPVPGRTANLEVQRYQGQPVLTWWQWTPTVPGSRQSEDVIMNRSYQRVAVVHAGDGYSADLHEFQITPQGTALIDTWAPVQIDLQKVGGPVSAPVLDCDIQELDIKTGQVLWQWDSLGHIPLNASYEPLPAPGHRWGFCHLNSIQQLPGGNLLVSMRHTWGVYLINKQTGKIIWTLGGKYSNFALGPGAEFEWQHDAHLTGDTLTVFDDASNGLPGSPHQRQSSAKTIQLNTSTMTATLVRHYVHSPPLLAPAEGSAQTLPDGNMFVGWGSQPEFSEYAPTGEQILAGRLALGVHSYRAYRFPWSGQPLTRPSLGLDPGPGGRVTTFASWNGATQVTGWRVLGGSGSRLRSLGQMPNAGFQSVSTVDSEPPELAVQALGSGGRVLGTSLPVSNPAHVDIFGQRSFISAATAKGAVAVGCFTASPCRLSLRVTSAGTILAQTAPQPVSAGGGALIRFELSALGLRLLEAARGRQLPAQVSLRDASGARATMNMDLIEFSIGGAHPGRNISQSPVVQIAQDTGFVSSTGVGIIMTACHAATPCEMRLSVRSGGVQIARQSHEYVGANELAYLPFRLDAAGRAMLHSARGNQLPAEVSLSSGQDTARGKLPLVQYG